MPSSVNLWVGLDVHKESVTAAVFRNRDPEPMRVDRLPCDLRRIRRSFQRLQAEGTARACYEASGAGYVLQRSLTEWGVEYHPAAPSLIPRRAGERRKADRRDVIKIARDFRDHRLVHIHVPTEVDERVRVSPAGSSWTARARRTMSSSHSGIAQRLREGRWQVG